MIPWLMVAALLGLVAPVADLEATSAKAAAARVPIVLYVSRSDCSFCRRFEQEVLNPLIRSGELADRAVIRELTWDALTPVVDFDGTLVQPEALAQSYDARVTPTLLFLDPAGREVVPRITGYPRSEFFSYYLEEAIREAWRRLQPAEATR